MKDYLGNELKIGDRVIFVQLGYRNFYEGVVEKLTDKTIFIVHDADNTGRTRTKQEFNQVIKI